jgi:uncharacterized protein (TIGR00251 family)
MLVRVNVKAGARREKFVELMKDSFTVDVKEEAERNQANNRVRALIALHFRVPLKEVMIVSGHKNPKKTIRVIR